MAIQRIPACFKEDYYFSRFLFKKIREKRMTMSMKDFKNSSDHLLEFVTDWKTEIIRSRPSEARTVIFIGVHCRRTDFADHYQEVSGASLVDHIFFDKAFDIYR